MNNFGKGMQGRDFVLERFAACTFRLFKIKYTPQERRGRYSGDICVDNRWFEMDGPDHQTLEGRRKDSKRDRELKDIHGIYVHRYPRTEIINNPGEFIDKIFTQLPDAVTQSLHMNGGFKKKEEFRLVMRLLEDPEWRDLIRARIRLKDRKELLEEIDLDLLITNLESKGYNVKKK